MNKYVELMQGQVDSWEHGARYWQAVMPQDDRAKNAAVTCRKNATDWQRMAEAFEAMVEALKEAKHVWEQGCVDRGYADERNWIDAASDAIDDALALAEPKEE